MRDVDVCSRSALTSWGIPRGSIALVLSLSLYVSHPQITPRASDTVATSGLTRLPLSFTLVRWTAEFLRSWTAICPESAREAMSMYRLFLVLSKGLNFFVFYSLFGKIRIGVMKMKWWLKDSFNDMYSWEFSVQYRKRKSVLSKAVLSFILIEIFADVHRAAFTSARSSQHLESYRQERHRVKLN